MVCPHWWSTVDDNGCLLHQMVMRVCKVIIHVSSATLLCSHEMLLSGMWVGGKFNLAILDQQSPCSCCTPALVGRDTSSPLCPRLWLSSSCCLFKSKEFHRWVGVAVLVCPFVVVGEDGANATFQWHMFIILVMSAGERTYGDGRAGC